MCLAFKNDLSEFLIHIFVFIVEYLHFSTSPKSDLKIVKPVLTHDFYISILLIKSENSIKTKIQMRQNKILTWIITLYNH